MGKTTQYKLPTAEDGVAGFLGMAGVFGVRETLDFLSIGFQDSGLSEARQILAARLVADRMRERPDLTFTEARRAVGNELGYNGSKLSNFNRMAIPGRDLLTLSGEWPFTGEARDQ